MKLKDVMPHYDEYVRLTLRSGKIMTGRLSDLEQSLDTAFLLSNKVMYTIPMKDIVRLEVIE